MFLPWRWPGAPESGFLSAENAGPRLGSARQRDVCFPLARVEILQTILSILVEEDEGGKVNQIVIFSMI